MRTNPHHRQHANYPREESSAPERLTSKKLQAREAAGWEAAREADRKHAQMMADALARFDAMQASK